MKEKIRELLQQGVTYSKITEITGRSKATISYHAKKIGLSTPRDTKSYDWREINSFYQECKSPTKTIKSYGMSNRTFDKALKRGDLTWVDPKIPLEELLKREKTSRQHLKSRLKDADLLEQKCAICGITEWLNKELSLHLDHINGKKNDNKLENLRLLCPNCHSQTPTYGGKNKGKGIDK